MNKVLGLDLGKARVGVAISDDLGMLAHPLETIQVKKGKVLDRILTIIEQKKVNAVVIGMPKNMDGTQGDAAQHSKDFADQLRGKTDCQVRLWDERLTTVAAQRELHQLGKNTKKSRAIIDQVAAQHILQGYLDSLGFENQ